MPISSGPSSSQSSASRSSTRRAYDAGHSSSGAPGFLAGLAVVAGGVESESDGNASHLAACIEAHGSSAPFTASSSMPGISVTAMYSGDPARGHACGAFVCCCLRKPLNLLERCDPVGDPDGIANMCCCKCGDKKGLPQFGRNGFCAPVAVVCGAPPDLQNCAKLRAEGALQYARTRGRWIDR